ncbi:MAG: hypothetical protein WBR18_05280, partial [Anaerolineales bacterium]
MKNTRSNLLAQHPLGAYFVLAFALSWLIQVPLALQAQGIIGTHLPLGLHYVTGFGPLLSAFIVAYASTRRDGVIQLLKRLGKWRVGIGWWLAALSPLFGLIAISVVTRAVQGSAIGISQLGTIDHFPALGIGTLFFWIVTFGLGEETGWRGFALPRLQQGRSALAATVI